MCLLVTSVGGMDTVWRLLNVPIAPLDLGAQGIKFIFNMDRVYFCLNTLLVVRMRTKKKKLTLVICE